MGIGVHFRRLFWKNIEIRGHGPYFLGLSWLAVAAKLSRLFIAESLWLYETAEVASRTTVGLHLSHISENVAYWQPNGAPLILLVYLLNSCFWRKYWFYPDFVAAKSNDLEFYQLLNRRKSCYNRSKEWPRVPRWRHHSICCYSDGERTLI